MMKKFIFCILLLLWQGLAWASILNTLTERKNIIYLGLEKTVYRSGDRLGIFYNLPVDIFKLLEKSDLHLVVISPLSDEPLDILLPTAVANQFLKLYQEDDVINLPMGEYYFSLILTAPGKDALHINNWLQGIYGRIDWQRIKITEGSDPEDLNQDGYIDNDNNSDGLADPLLGSSYNEDPIRLNKHVLYPNDSLTISYNLSNRLSDVFAGRANAFILITLPEQQTLSFPLAALNPEQNITLLELTDISSLSAGDYLISIVFTKPGGDPLLVKDWKQDISPINSIDRLRINTGNRDTQDIRKQGQIDGDTNNDGLADIPNLEKNISALCNNDNGCLYNDLPRSLALSAQQSSLLDILCSDNVGCVATLVDNNYQFQLDTNALLQIVCASQESSCLNRKTAAAVEFIENKTVIRHINNDLLCANITNEQCNNFLNPLYKQLNNPLLNQVCEGNQCGANGGFLDLVKNETEFQKLVVDICQYNFACEDVLFGNTPNNTTQFSELVCTNSQATRCGDLVSRYVANDNRYNAIINAICASSDLCAELIAMSTSNAAFLLERKQAIVDYCQTDLDCLLTKIPTMLRQRNTVSVFSAEYEAQQNAFCPQNLTETQFSACLTLFDSNAFLFNTLETDADFEAALSEQNFDLFDDGFFDIDQLTPFEEFDIETFDYCDLNFDGTVTTAENKLCENLDPCDFNFDGTVSAEETAACGTTTTENIDPCDLNADGTVSDAEAAACDTTTEEFFDICDFDFDGVVTEAEQQACDAQL